MSNDRGFTLIEILVATALVAILSIVVMSFLSSRVVQSAHQSARDNLLREAQSTLDNLMNDIRHASNADDQNRWPDEYAPEIDDEYSWESNGNTLVLAGPAIDNNNNFIYLDPFAYITHKDNLIYFIENNVLYKRVLAAEVDNNSASTTCPAGNTGCPADVALANYVEEFVVRYINDQEEEVDPTAARAVEVSLRLRRNVYNRDVVVEYSSKAVFRNE